MLDYNPIKVTRYEDYNVLKQDVESELTEELPF